MGRTDSQRRYRTDLAWYLAGIVLVQLGLAIGVDRFGVGVRDPEYAEIEQIVRTRVEAAPGRPLVLALGSSRTQMALAAGRLNHADEPAAPLVVNAAVAGGFAMTGQVVLNRLLRQGIVPQLVFIEVTPLALSRRDGAAAEERFPNQGRYSLHELGRLWKYYGEPYRLCYPWLLSRICPSVRYQAELRMALSLDLPPPEQRPARQSGRDAYGWLAYRNELSPAQREHEQLRALEFWSTALKQPAIAPGAVRALRDLVQRCRDRQIAVVLVLSAEGTPFRAYAGEVAAAHLNAVQQLVYELGVPLIDGRRWVDDANLWDGHHATHRGAVQYTERFAREALAPQLELWRGPR